MSSANKTARFGLSDFIGTDKPQMEDFNADNRIIDLNAAKLSSIGETGWDSGNFSKLSGTFTPFLVGLTVAGSPVHSVQAGTYHKIGSIVFCKLQIAVTSLGGATGQIRIDGLPIQATSSTIFNLPQNFAITGFTNGIKGLIGTTFGGGSFTGMLIRENVSNANLSTTNIPVPFDTNLIEFFYFA